METTISIKRSSIKFWFTIFKVDIGIHNLSPNNQVLFHHIELLQKNELEFFQNLYDNQYNLSYPILLDRKETHKNIRIKKEEIQIILNELIKLEETMFLTIFPLLNNYLDQRLEKTSENIDIDKLSIDNLIHILEEKDNQYFSILNNSNK